MSGIEVMAGCGIEVKGGRLEPLARIELGRDAPAEVIRLLPLVGLEPLLGPGPGAPLAATSADTPRPAIRVAFVGRDQERVGRCAERIDTAEMPDAPVAPATLTIALQPTPLAEYCTADLVTDSALAAVCFILSRALGLAASFLTADPGLFDVIRAATAVARGPSRILVEGEIGVGKESLIKLIHAASRDPAGLVHADCAGLEADALEAEFTPLLRQAAKSDSAHLHAAGGAIFFNRLGELSPPAQRKLLDLLRPYAPAVPGRHDAPAPGTGHDSPECIAGVRILAAATRALDPAPGDRGLLPELHDLFDATLTISPLRARRGDLPLLVMHYLRGLNPALTINAAAMRALSVYPFPGNVLELTNFVTRIAIVPRKAAPRRAATGDAAASEVGRTATGDATSRVVGDTAIGAAATSGVRRSAIGDATSGVVGRAGIKDATSLGRAAIGDAAASVVGRSAIGDAAAHIVGRAEVISQLNRGSLNTVWRAHDRRNSSANRSTRIAAPPIAQSAADIDQPGANEQRCANEAEQGRALPAGDSEATQGRALQHLKPGKAPLGGDNQAAKSRTPPTAPQLRPNRVPLAGDNEAAQSRVPPVLPKLGPGRALPAGANQAAQRRTLPTGDNEAPQGKAPLALPKLESPASLRLTTATVPRLRKPRGPAKPPT